MKSISEKSITQNRVASGISYADTGVLRGSWSVGEVGVSLFAALAQYLLKNHEKPSKEAMTTGRGGSGNKAMVSLRTIISRQILSKMTNLGTSF